MDTYSSTKLTHDSDKLVAIHGMAMRIKDVFGGHYAASLFSRNMNSQLLWHVIDLIPVIVRLGASPLLGHGPQ